MNFENIKKKADSSIEEKPDFIDDNDITHQILKIWMSQEFYEFRDGDSHNFDNDNIIPRTLEYCMKNYRNWDVVTNWDINLNNEQKKMVNNDIWRKCLYFRPEDKPDEIFNE